MRHPFSSNIWQLHPGPSWPRNMKTVWSSKTEISFDWKWNLPADRNLSSLGTTKINFSHPAIVLKSKIWPTVRFSKSPRLIALIEANIPSNCRADWARIAHLFSSPWPVRIPNSCSINSIKFSDKIGLQIGRRCQVNRSQRTFWNRSSRYIGNHQKMMEVVKLHVTSSNTTG